jgi:hypothetical protein
VGQSTVGSGTISGLTATSANTFYYVYAVNSGGCQSNSSSPVSISIKPSASEYSINAADVWICEHDLTATLTASSSIADPVFKWYDTQISTPELYEGASFTTTSNLTTSRSYFVSVSGTGYCENVTDSRKEVKVTVRSQSLYDYPDIRADVCSDISPINLGKYLDTTALLSVSWEKVSGTADINTNGIITSGLPNAHVHTYKYTITNHCVSGLVRKFYLQTIKDATVRPVRDTIAVCWEKAENIQLNQIFGIDAGGSWIYDGAINSYVSTLLVAPYTGATIFNGKAAYLDTGILYDGSYHIANSKSIVFKYKADSSGCLAGKEYTIVIVLTPDIIN